MSDKKANCPQCGQAIRISSDNRWRPFCSERCRLIDLGIWLEGNNHLPSEEPVDFDDLPDDDVTRH